MYNFRLNNELCFVSLTLTPNMITRLSDINNHRGSKFPNFVCVGKFKIKKMKTPNEHAERQFYLRQLRK